MVYKDKLNGDRLINENFVAELYSKRFNKSNETPTKTRRILEVQSDLFQKGRDKDVLVNPQVGQKVVKPFEQYLGEGTITAVNNNGTIDVEYDSGGRDNGARPGRYTKIPQLKSHNQFLQLLNKDNNWVRFFIQSIVQDSAKKGYEKVLFPTGDTASKVEGHATLEEFKKQKEDRIKDLDKLITNKEDENEDLETSIGRRSINRENRNKYEDEKKQLQEELKRVETEGFAALKPIYNFYENTVGNILKKIYGKDGVVRVKDEYGNEWYEVGIEQKRDSSHIYFQVQQPLEFRDAVDRIVTGFKGLRQAYPNSRTM